jgi:agmatinase
LRELTARDAGDLNLSVTASTAFEQIESAVSEIIEIGSTPIILGGDHSITIPSFRAVHSHHKNLKLLYFDAHPDLYSDFQGDRLSHACVVARILELDGISGSDITQVGIRTTSCEQIPAQKETGINTIHAWEIEEFLYKEEAHVYLSIDIDVLDPAFAPGCGNPVPGGITTRELISAIRKIKANVVAVDLVEVNPQIDASGNTAVAAVRILAETLAVISRQEKTSS